MPKVHYIVPVNKKTLKPGVSGADLEKFFVEEYQPQASEVELPGHTMSLHRADHGKEVGQYLLIGNFESIERNEQLFPNHEPGEETKQFMSTPIAQKLLSHFDFQKMSTEATTYIALS